MIVSELEDSQTEIPYFFYIAELNGLFYIIVSPSHRNNGTEVFDGRFNGRQYKRQQDAKAAISKFTMQEMVWSKAEDIQMSEFKEVWYVWDGVGEKPKNIKGVLFSDGYIITDDSSIDSYGLAWLNSHPYESEWKYISAYTLGQKRRRCVACDGNGISRVLHRHNCGFYSSKSSTCMTCNGTGWEYEK